MLKSYFSSISSIFEYDLDIDIFGKAGADGIVAGTGCDVGADACAPIPVALGRGEATMVYEVAFYVTRGQPFNAFKTRNDALFGVPRQFPGAGVCRGRPQQRAGCGGHGPRGTEPHLAGALGRQQRGAWGAAPWPWPSDLHGGALRLQQGLGAAANGAA